MTKSILIINRVFPPTFGATGRMACDLALNLRKKGYKVTVLATAASAKTDTAKNLDIIRIGANPRPEGILAYTAILKALKTKAKTLPKHDIVISMTDPPLLATIGHDIAKRMKAKHIHWAMDLYPDLLPIMDKDISKWAYRWAERKMHKSIRLAHAIVPISRCMARYMTHQSLPRHKMHIIENWPDRYLLEHEEEEIESLFDNQKFRILYAGTIGLAHDFTAVLKAAKYLKTSNPEVEFVFTGTGKGKQAFEDQVKRMNLANIRFIQLQSSKKLDTLMATGDLHLITMKEDAAGMLFPSKFYAACAAARPVVYIGPQACDLHDKITRYKCGASIRNDDAQGLVKAIRYYLNNSEAWFKAGESIASILNDHNPLQEWEDLIASC